MNFLKGTDMETSEVVPEDVVKVGETGWYVHRLRPCEFFADRLKCGLGLLWRLLTMLKDDTRVRVLLGEVGGGVEGGRQDVARLEGREGEGVAALRGIQVEHEVYGSGDGG